jgi:hypothetical protein
VGLFDSFRDALRPDDYPEHEQDDPAAWDGPKHLDEGAPPEPAADPGEMEQPTGGKHARREGAP